MYEGREIIVTKSSEPGGKCPSLTHSALTEDLIEGGYVMEGEGLPDNLPPWEVGAQSAYPPNPIGQPRQMAPHNMGYPTSAEGGGYADAQG